MTEVGADLVKGVASWALDAGAANEFRSLYIETQWPRGMISTPLFLFSEKMQPQKAILKGCGFWAINSILC
jgi:hypothetical protein